MSEKKSVRKPLHVDPLLMAALLQADAELKNAYLTIKVHELEWQKQVAAHEVKRTQLTAAVNDANKTFQDVQQKIEKRYKITLRDWAYDIHTRVLSPVGE